MADSDFVGKMHDLILSHNLLIISFTCLGTSWEDLKASLQRTCVDYSVQKRKRLNRERDLFTEQRIRAKQFFLVTTDTWIQSITLKKFTSLIKKSCEGAYIRLRAKWIGKGEKPTFFSSVLGRNGWRIPFILF